MCEFIDEKSEQEEIDYVSSIDIYDTKIDDDAKTASLQADDCLKMIGKAPATCTSIEEQQNYYRINMQLVARNKALEDMIAIYKKEIESLKRSLYNHVS